MSKRYCLVGVILLLLSWLLVGCGVNQEQYDAVVADLDKAQRELQSVKADYEKLTTEYTDLQVEKPSLTTDMESLEADYDKLSAEYEDLLAEKNSLMTEKESLQADYNELNTRNTTITTELAEIKESYESVSQELSDLQAVYPPRHFSTLQELQTWVSSNAISGTPIHHDLLLSYDAYARALEIQGAAFRDGFIISVVVYGYSIDGILIKRICCMASVDDGIYYWLPDRDDIQISADVVTEEMDAFGNWIQIEPRLEIELE